MVQWERVFCDTDDFCQQFLPAWERQWLEAGVKQRVRPSAVSEVMTIVIVFPRARFRDFKHFYLDFVSRYHRAAFPPSAELLTGCGTYALCAHAPGCLWAHPLGAGDRHRLYRLDPLGGLSS
jgi:hypothetical protein